MPHVSKSVTIRRPREEVYRFWRALENLPRFMFHLQSVRSIDGRRSHWAVKGPGGGTIEWDAELIDDRPGERLAWRSLEGSEIHHAGSVEFRDAPGDRGTEVDVSLDYDAPGGKAGTMIAKLFGEEPLQQIRDDLRRFKQVMETGEVVLSDGSLEGAGEGAMKERAARAPGMETRS